MPPSAVATLNDFVVISADELRELVSLDDAMCAVRDAFVALAHGVVQQPQRLAMADGSTLAMMARGGPTSGTAVKIVSLREDNRVRGLATIQGSVLWLDGESGRPQFLVDGTSVTTLRTAAATGIATALLAPPGATRLAMIGAGAQAPDQLRAVAAVRPIEEIRIFSRGQTSAFSLAGALADELAPARLKPVTSLECAVDGADVVCSATDTTVPIVLLRHLSPRVHINAIGSHRAGMRELARDVIAAAQVLCVDQISAALTEAGEFIDAVEHGVIDSNDLVELGQAIENPPVVDNGISIFKSVGVAIQDWAVARLLAERLALPRTAV